MAERKIHITEPDMARLRDLLASAKRRNYHRDLAVLEAELARASVVPPHRIPSDVVTMNSQVVLRDMQTRRNTTYTLVFPEDASLEDNRISVLAPIGMALLGQKKGDSIEWRVPAGIRRLKVLDVVFQPEAAGQFHL